MGPHRIERTHRTLRPSRRVVEGGDPMKPPAACSSVFDPRAPTCNLQGTASLLVIQERSAHEVGPDFQAGRRWARALTDPLPSPSARPSVPPYPLWGKPLEEAGAGATGRPHRLRARRSRPTSEAAPFPHPTAHRSPGRRSWSGTGRFARQGIHAD
jgi:hypothetical protein